MQRPPLHPLSAPCSLAHLMVAVENPLVFVSFPAVVVFALFLAAAVFALFPPVVFSGAVYLSQDSPLELMIVPVLSRRRSSQIHL